MNQSHQLKLVTPKNYCRTPRKVLDAPHDDINSFDDCFKYVGTQYKIDWHLLKAIALTENGGHLNSQAESVDGKAIGLMQVRAGNLNGQNWKKLAETFPVNEVMLNGIAVLADRYKHSIYNQDTWWPQIKKQLKDACTNIAAGAILYLNALSMAKGKWSDALSLYNKGTDYYTGNEQVKKEGYQYQVQVVKYYRQLVSSHI